MIEVRIDVQLMQMHQHNIMHSILMMKALREAGVPVIGKIIFSGPERGVLVQWREQDMDGDEWVVRWYDENENNNDTGVTYHKISTGVGVGFSWARYEDANRSHEKTLTFPRLLWHPESESLFMVENEAEYRNCVECETAEDVHDIEGFQERYRSEQKASTTIDKEEW